MRLRTGDGKAFGQCRTGRRSVRKCVTFRGQTGDGSSLDADQLVLFPVRLLMLLATVPHLTTPRAPHQRLTRSAELTGRHGIHNFSSGFRVFGDRVCTDEQLRQWRVGASSGRGYFTTWVTISPLGGANHLLVCKSANRANVVKWLPQSAARK